MKAERLYYLRRMNAWTPPVAAPVALPARPAEGAKTKRPTPTTRIVQGLPHRYRLRYTKLGRVAFLGHLDLIRHLPRIFRRAGLEIFYSVGFHPKPDLSFGPALGLGIPSLGELLDVKLVDDVAPAELGKQAGTLVVRREAENKIDRMIDLRKSVRQVSRLTNGQAELRRRLDWEGGELLRFQVAVSHEGSARPSEIVTALFDEEIAGQVELARTALWALDDSGASTRLLDPLETEDLRARPKAAAPRPTAPSQIA